jgi:acetylornithine deacetylase/succinyl-diaminopimelate desuccinylase-like protein
LDSGFRAGCNGHNQPIVKTLGNSHTVVKRESAQIGAFETTSDMKFLVNDAKMDAVIYGPGCLKNAHSIDEYVPIE